MPGARRMRRLARAMFGGRGRRVDPAAAGPPTGGDRRGRARRARPLLTRCSPPRPATRSSRRASTGVITFFNEGAERLLGYEAAERRRQDARHRPAPPRGDRRPSRRSSGVEPGRAVFTTLAAGRADTREWTFVRADGSHVRVTHTVTTQRDASGAVVGFVGLAHDITARHQAEQALRKSEERFRALSEHAPVGIVQTDEHGSCWYANRRFCELVGRTEDEVRGTGWIEALSATTTPACSTGWTHELGEGRASTASSWSTAPTAPPCTCARPRGRSGPTTGASRASSSPRRTSPSGSARSGACPSPSSSSATRSRTSRWPRRSSTRPATSSTATRTWPRCSAGRRPTSSARLVRRHRAAGALVDARDLRADDARRDRAAPPREPDRDGERRAARDQLVDDRPPRRRRHGGRRHLARRGRDRAAPGRAARLAPGLPRRPHRPAEPDVVRRPPRRRPSPRPSAARPRSPCSSATSTRSSS